MGLDERSKGVLLREIVEVTRRARGIRITDGKGGYAMSDLLVHDVKEETLRQIGEIAKKKAGRSSRRPGRSLNRPSNTTSR